MSDAPPGQRQTKTFLLGDPRFPGLAEDHLRRAEDVLNGDNLVEMILYAHLLLEQALETLIGVAFRRPGVLRDREFARLTFAQKITVFVGLYEPDEETVWELQAFNRLRNRMAHSLVDLDGEVRTILWAYPDDVSAHERVRSTFLSVVALGLGAAHGLGFADDEDGAPTDRTPWVRLDKDGSWVGEQGMAAPGQSWWPWGGGQRTGQQGPVEPD